MCALYTKNNKQKINIRVLCYINYNEDNLLQITDYLL